MEQNKHDPILVNEVLRLLSHFGTSGALSESFVSYFEQHSPLFVPNQWTHAHVRTILSAYSSKKPIKPIVRVSRSLLGGGFGGAGVGAITMGGLQLPGKHRRRGSSWSNKGNDPQLAAGGASTAASSGHLFYMTRPHYLHLSELAAREETRVQIEVLSAKLAEEAISAEEYKRQQNKLLPFHVFPVVLFQNEVPETATIYHRFSEFDQLMHALKLEYSLLPLPQIPEKRVFGNSQPAFLECRRTALECMINQLMDHDTLRCHPLLRRFLTTSLGESYLKARSSSVSLPPSSSSSSSSSVESKSVAKSVGDEPSPELIAMLQSTFIHIWSGQSLSTRDTDFRLCALLRELRDFIQAASNTSLPSSQSSSSSSSSKSSSSSSFSTSSVSALSSSSSSVKPPTPQPALAFFSDMSHRWRHLGDLLDRTVRYSHQLGQADKDVGIAWSAFITSLCTLLELLGVSQSVLAPTARLGQRCFDLGRWQDLIFSERLNHIAGSSKTLGYWLSANARMLLPKQPTSQPPNGLSSLPPVSELSAFLDSSRSRSTSLSIQPPSSSVPISSSTSPAAHSLASPSASSASVSNQTSPLMLKPGIMTPVVDGAFLMSAGPTPPMSRSTSSSNLPELTQNPLAANIGPSFSNQISPSAASSLRPRPPPPPTSAAPKFPPNHPALSSPSGTVPSQDPSSSVSNSSNSLSPSSSSTATTTTTSLSPQSIIESKTSPSNSVLQQPAAASVPVLVKVQPVNQLKVVLVPVAQDRRVPVLSPVEAPKPAQLYHVPVSPVQVSPVPIAVSTASTTSSISSYVIAQDIPPRVVSPVNVPILVRCSTTSPSADVQSDDSKHEKLVEISSSFQLPSDADASFAKAKLFLSGPIPVQSRHFAGLPVERACSVDRDDISSISTVNSIQLRRDHSKEAEAGAGDACKEPRKAAAAAAMVMRNDPNLYDTDWADAGTKTLANEVVQYQRFRSRHLRESMLLFVRKQISLAKSQVSMWQSMAQLVQSDWPRDFSTLMFSSVPDDCQPSTSVSASSSPALSSTDVDHESSSSSSSAPSRGVHFAENVQINVTGGGACGSFVTPLPRMSQDEGRYHDSKYDEADARDEFTATRVKVNLPRGKLPIGAQMINPRAEMDWGNANEKPKPFRPLLSWKRGSSSMKPSSSAGVEAGDSIRSSMNDATAVMSGFEHSSTPLEDEVVPSSSSSLPTADRKDPSWLQSLSSTTSNLASSSITDASSQPIDVIYHDQSSFGNESDKDDEDDDETEEATDDEASDESDQDDGEDYKADVSSGQSSVDQTNTSSYSIPDSSLPPASVRSTIVVGNSDAVSSSSEPSATTIVQVSEASSASAAASSSIKASEVDPALETVRLITPTTAARIFRPKNSTVKPVGSEENLQRPANVEESKVEYVILRRASDAADQKQKFNVEVTDQTPEIQDSKLAQEWRIKFSELKLGKVIGAGSFGVVHDGLLRGCEVAIKRFTLIDLTPDALKEFHEETQLMSQLMHRNIVLFLGACLQPPHLCLVTERLDMSVRDLLASSTPLRITHVLKMALDACRGIHYLHARTPPILHRDLKSSNLLVSQENGGEYRVAVCDFGLAKVKRQGQAALTMCGTTMWIAPEIFTGQGWSEKADVYSLAIVLWELFTRRLPHEDISSPHVVMFKVVSDSLRPAIPATVPAQVAELMKKCWAQDPKDRPTIRDMIDSLTQLLRFFSQPTRDTYL